jgi:UDP-2-acetamido-3-amino-2,3-dideoxy-glucuronate N-acetyltransferase
MKSYSGSKLSKTLLKRGTDNLRLPTSATWSKLVTSNSAPAKIHPSSFVDEGAEIGEGTVIWHFSHILPQTKVGNNVSIGQNVVVGPRAYVGNGCKIQNNVSLYEGVTLEDEVFCGPSCVFTNVTTPRAFVSRKSEFGATLLKYRCSIGANATIVCPRIIGEYAFIAAGAVVTKDVVPYALMAGVPARRIGWVSRTGDVLKDDLICPRSGDVYETKDGQLVLVTEGPNPIN